eukprot:787322-Rhodomonas_salina.1
MTQPLDWTARCERLSGGRVTQTGYVNSSSWLCEVRQLIMAIEIGWGVAWCIGAEGRMADGVVAQAMQGSHREGAHLRPGNGQEEGRQVRARGSRFTVHGSRFTVHGSRFSPVFTVHRSRSRVHGPWFTVYGSRFTVQSPAFTVHRSRLRVHGPCFSVQHSAFGAECRLQGAGSWAIETQGDQKEGHAGSVRG